MSAHTLHAWMPSFNTSWMVGDSTYKICHIRHPGTDVLHLLSGRRPGKESATLPVHSTGCRWGNQTHKHTTAIEQAPTVHLSYRPIQPHYYNQRKSIEGGPSTRLRHFLLYRKIWMLSWLNTCEIPLATPWPLVFNSETSLPMISSTSPYRLQPIYYSYVSATIRRSKILVHTPSLAPLPILRGPGHTRMLRWILGFGLKQYFLWGYAVSTNWQGRILHILLQSFEYFLWRQSKPS